uniref:response regulator n=1 Tax=Thaumasiovibrio occultus TaxID=1891184 RepID=UPI000B35F6ED|nr:response regulator [Thaumasiovibrio occultus]
MGDLSTLTTLVVDSNNASAMQLKSQLHAIGVGRVDHARNGEQAIGAVRGASYDILLVEIHLDSAMNGCDLVASLRQKQLIERNCAVVFVSSEQSASAVISAYSLNMDGFIVKPLRIIDLENKLTALKQNIETLTPIYRALEQNSPAKAIELLTKICVREPNNRRLEHTLLSLLESQQYWQALERWLAYKTGFSQRRQLAKSRLLWHKQNYSGAIKTLERLTNRLPRYVFAFDQLRDFYSARNQQQEALRCAKRAAHIAPMVGTRSLIYAELAAKTAQYPELMDAGELLVKHIGLQKQQWLAPLCRYFDSYIRLAMETEFESLKKHLLRQKRVIFQTLRLRIAQSDRALLKALSRITDSYILLSMGERQAAYIFLMRSMAGSFQCVADLPPLLAQLYRFPAMALGERWIVNNVELHRHHSNQAGQDLFTAQLAASHAGKYQHYSEEIAELHNMVETQPKQVLSRLWPLQQDYDQVLELKLLLLRAMSAVCGDTSTRMPTQALPSTTPTPTPEAMTQWVASLNSSFALQDSYRHRFAAECIKTQIAVISPAVTSKIMQINE